MDAPTWMNAESYVRMRYGVPEGKEPTKAQFNSVYRALNLGTIPGTKHGRRWLVKVEVTNAKS